LMKQLLQNLRSGETYVAEVPVPAPRPGAALVQTAASLVSVGTERMVVEFAEKSLVGKARSRPDLVRQVVDKARREGLITTLEAAFNRLDQPMVLGYSSAGTILACGAGLQGYQPGDRVVCAGGGYAVHAEFALVPQNLLAHLPENVPFEQGAFATLGAIALHGFRLSEARVGEQVAVIGLGLLGLLAAAVARAAGCPVLGIDTDPARVALGAQMGLEVCVIRAEAEAAAAAFSRGRGLDAVLICADTPSADPVELAGQIARDRGRVVALGAVGLSLPRKIYYEKELSFINSRSYGPGRYDPAYEENGQDYPLGYVRWTEGRNLEAVASLLGSGKLDVSPLITHRFPIEEAPQAYQLITGKQPEPFLGVLILYPQQSAPPLSGLIAGPATSTGRESSEAVSPPGEVRLGVLGAGNFATAVMLPAVSKLSTVRLEAIASASGVSAQHAARKFGFARSAAHTGEILADPAVNTVAVLTRHHLHAAQVCAALQARKHVFCEKPLAIYPAELEMVEAALESSPQGLYLAVGFNRRFAPLAVRLKAFLSSRQEPFAAHYRVNAGFLPPSHWLHDPAQGGGRIIGEGCHFIDFLVFLAGSLPLEVIARALPDAGRYHQDNVLLTFTFPDGSLGTLSYLANGDKSFPKERVEVFCGGKVAVLDDFRSLELVHDGQRQVQRARLKQDKGHQAIWGAFAQAVLSGGSPPIAYPELFGVTRAAFAAVESLQRGEPVHITQSG
jgi:predicted dehydrogenase/threonine dehydrogenase-like Zn-dependent dehydrogenase